MLLCRDDPLLPLLLERRGRAVVMDENPTAENIARPIFDRVREAGLPVVEVVLRETDNCGSAYSSRRQ
jgi:6-pyruvoyltetrahydropterin/6-carboxytetrahydropterin synthase